MATNSVLDEKESTKSGADGDTSHRSEGGDNGSVKKMIKGIPVTQLEDILKVLSAENSERFLEWSVAEIRRELEKRMNLSPRTLKNAPGLVALIGAFDTDLAKREKNKDKNREKDRQKKDRERDRHKSSSRDRDRKSHNSQKSSQRKSQDKKSKRRRSHSDSDDSDRPAKKPKRYSYTSSSESDSYRRKKNKKKDLDDPVVRKNERLRKLIKDCGVPLQGFSRDLSEEEIQKKLKKIIRDHEDEGMKERMDRSEIRRVRASISGKREIEELKQIPKNLQITEPKKGGRELRKVVKKRQSNDLTYTYQFPKTGDPYIDRESDSDDEDPKKKRQRI
jgi:hypothetical protein